MVAFEEERLHRDREVQEVRRKVTCNHDMLLSVHCGGGVGVGRATDQHVECEVSFHLFYLLRIQLCVYHTGRIHLQSCRSNDMLHTGQQRHNDSLPPS